MNTLKVWLRGNSSTITILWPLLLIYILTLSLSTVKSDTWWHLRAGKDILAGDFKYEDSYSYTAEGRYWPDHEWAYQVFLYSLHWLSEVTFSAPFLIPLAVTALLMTAAIGLTLPSRETVRSLNLDLSFSWFALALTTAVTITVWSSTRPQVVSFFLFSLTCWLLRREKFWPIPFVILVWVQFHAAFLYGLMAIFAFFLGSLGHWAFHRSDRVALKRTLTLMAVGVLSALLSLVNPLGFGMWEYALADRSELIAHGVSEWTPGLRYDGFFVSLLLIVLFIIGFVHKRWHRVTSWVAISDLLLMAFAILLFISGVRHAPILSLALLAILIRVGSPERAAAPEPLTLRNGGRWIAPLVALGLAVAVTGPLFHAIEGRADVHPVSAKTVKEVRACIADRGGNLYTDYNTGAEFIWFTPEIPVFVDNRYDPYPKEILDAALKDFKKKDVLLPLLDRYNVNCAVIPEDSGLGGGVLGEAKWRLQSTDGRWIVLSRPADR